jgi:hypothetical protein
LINEKGGYELYPYEQITGVAKGNPSLRAFIFDRSGSTYVVYWHTSGEQQVKLNINSEKVHLSRELGKEIPVRKNNNGIIIPIGERRYLQVDMSREKVIEAFREATLLEG